MSDEFTQSCLEFKKAKGQAALRELLERVAGVTAMSMVPVDQQASVVAACNSGRGGGGGDRKAKARAPKPDFADPNWVQRVVYARWNSAGSAN